MLQIIGWLGCLYLVIKGLEIMSADSHRAEDGRLNDLATLAALLAILGAVAFAGLLAMQGSAMSGPLSESSGVPSPIYTDEEVKQRSTTNVLPYDAFDGR